MTRPRVLALAAVALVAVIAVAVAVAARGGGPGGGDRIGGERGPGTSTAAERFLARYVDADGRVVRHDEGGDTVSEGQAYALLVAAETGDQERFDRVWSWTQANLQRSDGLFAWRWEDGAVSDDSPATDADVDIARALALAGERFDQPDMADEARRIAAAVLDHETAEAGGRLVLVAGPWARDDRVVNPSYLATCGGADLAALTGDPRWARVAADGVELVAALAEEGLPPDWAILDDAGELDPIGGPDRRDAPGRYGLDAARIPARLPACPGGEEVAARLWVRLRALDDSGAALAYSLDGQPLEAARHPVGLIGAAGAARAAGDPGAARDLLARAADLDREHPTYYGAAWLAVGDAVLDLGGTPGGGAAASSVAWGRAAVRPAQDPTTTTVPPDTTVTTAPSTTAPPATVPPATAPPTTDSPPTSSPPTSAGPAVTTAPSSGPSPSTGTGAAPSPTSPGGPGSTPGAPGGAPPATGTDAPGRGSGAGDTGDLSTPGEPGAELRADPRGAAGGPGEPARRRTGGIALAGTAAVVALGAVMGLRERAHGLRARRHAAMTGDAVPG